MLLLLLAQACAAPDPTPFAKPETLPARRAAALDDWQLAGEELGFAVEDDGRPCPELYHEAGSALVRAGDYEGARALLDQGLDRFPGAPDLLELRADVLVALGFRRAAEQDLEECLALAPERSMAWRRLGEVRLELGLPTAALRALDECRRLGGEGQSFDLLDARVHRSLGEARPAADAYTRALDTGRPAPDWLIEGASMFADPALVGDAAGRERAWSWLDDVLRAAPENDCAHYVAGLLHERSGDIEAALVSYQKALAINARNVPALTQLAMVCVSDGRRKLAENAVQRALELEPHPARRRALAALLD